MVTSKKMSKGCVLIIDKDPVFIRGCSEFLTSQGYVVEAAMNTQDALTLFEDEHPDAVFCELEFNEMHGIDLLVQLRKSHPHVPIIMTSEEGHMSGVLSALRHGAHDFITKPLPEPSVLSHALESALGKDDAQRMQDEMEMAISELRYNRESLEQDESMASLFQASLLPEQQLDLGKFRVSWRMPLRPQPSRYFLDVFALSSQYVSFYIADFGEDTPDAAFASGALKVVFNEAFREFGHSNNKLLASPDGVMGWASYYLKSLELKQSPALIYALLDVEKGQMQWASASFDKGPYVWLGAATQTLSDAGPSLHDSDASDYSSHAFMVEESRPLVFSHLEGEQLRMLAQSDVNGALPSPLSDVLSQPFDNQSGGRDVFSLVVGRR
ncbi:response regulator [Echinimonas agarilytica]|uniref:Response regulator n=1 Tax=Echinimonas agarilytica TaxID=1215918 RepID=A0AA41W551_9GAMM|nr:response regulator [Echinimonas agarilytica]MCM2679008.1 response regulator [Echinimonas agarilytica]